MTKRPFDSPEMTPRRRALLDAIKQADPWMPPFNFAKTVYEDQPDGTVKAHLRRRLVNTRFLRVRLEERSLFKSRFNIRLWIGRVEIVWAPISKEDWK